MCIRDRARPTPAVGWCNTESLPLLERARDRFDCVMMLGILHHLLLADQIPMAEVATLLPHLDSLHRTLFFGAVRDAAVGRRRTA